jgi:hypothetical protein
MENDKFVGKGWVNQYGGIKIQLKLEEIQSLPVNQWGDVELYVGQRKSPDEKSKATHYVKYSQPQNPAMDNAVKKLNEYGFK